MESAKEATMYVSGMSCSGCASKVEKALTDLEGVDQVTVDLDDNEVTVIFEDGKITIEDLEKAVDSAGYTFEGLKEHN